MYLRSLVFVLLSVTLATAACSSKSASNSSDQSNAAATPAATTVASAEPGSSESPSSEPAMAGTPAAETNAGAPGVPVYPGAASQASASYSGGSGANSASVKAAVYTTTDSFDKVYAFYQKSLPGAMEMMHTSTPPTPGAAFVVADPNNKGHATTVVVSTGTDGKVTISIQASQSNQ
jgi:hypothetical protein